MNKIFMIAVPLLTIFAATIMAGVAMAQSASDFQAAAGKEGCASIPYSNLRDDCEDEQDEVDDWCKSSEKKWSCDKFDPEGLEKQIASVKRKTEDLKREKGSLESKKSGARDDKERRELEGKIIALSKEIKKYEEMINEWQKKLEEEKKEIKARISVGEQCLRHREGVQKIFDDAKRKAEGERDAAIKPHAQRVVEKYKAGEVRHRQAINDAKRAISNCKDML
jgi:chromosome segregation ATPase